MSGAYVAKPAADVPPVPPEWPDPPPGWDENWPSPGTPGLNDPATDPFFPAPFPPGYTPDYSMVVTATAEIAPNGTASVTGSLRDHGTYATNEPDNITWTATIDGEAVQVRFTDGDFASSISSSTSFSTYWGAAPSIEFDLTSDNDGDTVVLTGTSVIGGISVTQTAEIIVSAIITASLTVTYTIDSQGAFPIVLEWGILEGTETAFPDDQYGRSELLWSLASGYAVGESERNGVLCTQDTGTDTITVNIAEMDQEEFNVDLWLLPSRCTVSFTTTLVISRGATILDTYVKEDTFIYGQSFDDTWATINGTTGEVTIVNP